MNKISNPCRTCEHHLRGGDKNDERCVNCSDRLKYLCALNGFSGSMLPISAKSTEKQGEIKRMTKEKTCRRCKEIKSIEEFPKNKNCKDGYENVCRECRRNTRIKNKKPSKTSSSDHVSDNGGRSKITIDFSGHRDTLEEVSQIARKELRSVENQILFWLINSDFKKL